MQSYPKHITSDPKDIEYNLRIISRIREEDITDRNTFDSIYMRGRKVGKIPVAYNDIISSDRVGDFNYDENYFYLCVQSGSIAIWKTIPFTNFSRVYYGSMGADDISVNVTIASIGVYYKIMSGFTAGLTDGFTFQNNRELKCLNAGKYKIDYGVSLRAGVDDTVAATAIINTTELHLAESATNISSANKDYCVSGTGIVALSVNDVVGLCVENESSTNTINISHANLSILRVGD